MRIVQAGAVTLALALVPVSVWGVPMFTDGNQLHSDCQRDFHACSSYVRGVADTMLGNQGTPVMGWLACIPKGVTVGQMTDVVKASLTNHPEERHLGASSLVAAALAESFPCPTH